MKKIDTSSITLANGMPIKAGTLNHLQQSYTEAITASINSIIGSGYSPTAMYILYGCVNSGSGLNYVISAGAVYYNGEVFQVPAATFTATGSQVAVGLITAGFFTDPTADPVVFTDLISRNVHQVRTVVFSAGAPGCATCDFPYLLKVNSAQVPVNGAIPYFPVGGNLNEFDSTGKGIVINTLGWAICNGQNGTRNLAGQFLVGYNAADTDYQVVGQTGGSKTATLTLANLPPHQHGVPVASGTGNGAFAAGAVSGATEGQTSMGGEDGLVSTPFSIRPPYYVSLYIQRIY